MSLTKQIVDEFNRALSPVELEDGEVVEEDRPDEDWPTEEEMLWDAEREQ